MAITFNYESYSKLLLIEDLKWHHVVRKKILNNHGTNYITAM